VIMHDEILAAFQKRLSGSRGRELFFSESKRSCVQINPNRVAQRQMHTLVGVAGRTHLDGTLSFAYCDGYRGDMLDQLFRQRHRVATTGQIGEPFAKEHQGQELVVTRDLGACIPEVADSLYNKGHAAMLDIQKVYFQSQADNYCLANSHGVRGNGGSAFHSWGFEYYSARANVTLTYYTLQPDNRFDVATMITEAKDAVAMAEAPAVAFEDIPVLFTQAATSVLLFSLLSLMTSDALLNKRSFLPEPNNFENQIRLSNKVTVAENSCENMIHDGGIDGEGSRKREIGIVHRGVIASVLSDRLTGQRFGLKSTGSSWRKSFRDMPRVRGTKIAMSAGKDAKEQMLAQYPRVGVIGDLMGLTACLDPVSTRFQLVADVYLYNQSSIRGKNRVMIASSLIDIFSNVIDISSERRYGVDGSVYVPSMIVYPVKFVCV